MTLSNIGVYAKLSAAMVTINFNFRSSIIPAELPICLLSECVSVYPLVELFSKAIQLIAWRDLQDESVWRQGWV